MANLFDPPPKYVLPLSKYGDLSVEFRNNPSGDGTTFVNYDEDATLTLYIDTTPQTTAEASIVDSTATVKIESGETDDIASGTAWRLIYAVGGDDPASTETVVAYGKIKRYD